MDKNYRIEDSGLVYMHNLLHGPLVNSGEMACEIARLILRRLNGDQGAALEEPLQYRDDGDYWSVKGSHQPPEMAVGSGIWSIIINKSNARIVDLGRKLTLKTPDELSPVFKLNDEADGDA